MPPPPVAVSGPHAAAVSGTLAEQAAAIRRGELSSRELTRMYLERIEHDGLNTYLHVRGDQVLAEAARLDDRQASGEPLGPLHGVPLGLKDNLFTAGAPTTSGTSVLKGFVPDRDATVVRLLRAAWALVLGKTNLHECSFGITTNNPHFGPTRNPYDPERIPGGSSGGSGAAVAARLCSAAIGTDTGGSVRIPAALCGVVGIKPTLGRVSRAGVFGLSWTCDVVGPIARTVEDAAILLRVMAGGADPLDPDTTADPAGMPLTSAAADLRGVRIGVPGGWFVTDNTADVDRVLTEAYRKLEDLGATLVPVTVEGIDQAPGAGFRVVIPEGVVSLEEALRPVGGLAANLAHFGADLRAAMSKQVGPAAEPLPAAEYASTLRRTIPALRRAFAEALTGVDALLTPTTPATAVPIAQDVSMSHNGRTLDTFETFTRHTSGVSVTGLPAVSVPAGLGADNLPIGVQFVGAPWSESRLIGLAAAFQQ